MCDFPLPAGPTSSVMHPTGNPPRRAASSARMEVGRVADSVPRDLGTRECIRGEPSVCMHGKSRGSMQGQLGACLELFMVDEPFWSGEDVWGCCTSVGNGFDGSSCVRSAQGLGVGV